ncbi:MAG: C10 family peptidase [Bacteroidales bacterium]
MKHLLFSFLFITLTFALFAKGVEQNTARELALNAYYQKLVQYHDENAAYEELIITETYTISEGGIPMYFIYNFQDFGFIIIAAEDAIEPVLGYTFNSHYSSEDQPEGLAGTLSEYREHIDYLRSNQITQSTEIFQQWDDLYYFEASNFSATNNSKGDVEPLLTATWNQDDPYNFYCPEDQQGPGGRVYVGCVATAMSMIMHYWRYPLQGTGEHSYTPENTNYGVQYVNFGETTYDWDGMLDNCDGNVANLPMALIGYHTAVSVDMDFGNDGSGAYSTDVDNAFRDYFGYSNTTAYLSRSSYTLTIWENYLQAELNENRPVYYSGVDPSLTGGGHAFVLDGYHESDGFYHFNFGWSGSGNGWPLVTDAGGFTNQQGMVRNLYRTIPITHTVVLLMKGQVWKDHLKMAVAQLKTMPRMPIASG